MSFFFCVFFANIQHTQREGEGEEREGGRNANFAEKAFAQRETRSSLTRKHLPRAWAQMMETQPPPPQQEDDAYVAFFRFARRSNPFVRPTLARTAALKSFCWRQEEFASGVDFRVF